MKIKDITNYLEDFAPLEIQENYDNSGLIVGDYESDVRGILVTLDCVEEIVDEAIYKKCNLIVAHHPIIFKGLKKINGINYIERTVIKAIKNDIAIYAIHTNLDNIHNGVSFKIAKKIGLENCRVLAPKLKCLKQLVVYCPTNFSEKLRATLFENGAGSIGKYDNCSFTSFGKGTFLVDRNSKPFSGRLNELNIKDEDRIEVVFPKHKEKDILNAMIVSHPYEKVAYQIYSLENKNDMFGAGIVGELSKSSKA